MLALVWMAGAADVTLMPVAPDVHLASATTVLLEAAATDLGVEAGIWVSAESGASTAVLDYCLGELGGADLHAVGSIRLGVPSSSARVGTGPFGALDPVAQFEQHLRTELVAIASAADWDITDTEQPDLAPALGELDFDEMVDVLGSSRAALALSQGRRPASADELLRLRPLLETAGIEADWKPEDTGAPLPTELVATINQPRWKPHVVRTMQEKGWSERDTRRQKATEALQGPGLAARRDAGADPDWDHALEQVFS